MNQAIQFPDREEWDENKKMCMFSRSREWHATDMCDLWRESGVSFYLRQNYEFSSAWDLAENLIQEQSKMIKAGSGYPDRRPSISRNYSRNSVTQPSLFIT